MRRDRKKQPKCTKENKIHDAKTKDNNDNGNNTTNNNNNNNNDYDDDNRGQMNELMSD